MGYRDRAVHNMHRLKHCWWTWGQSSSNQTSNALHKQQSIQSVAATKKDREVFRFEDFCFQK